MPLLAPWLDQDRDIPISSICGLPFGLLVRISMWLKVENPHHLTYQQLENALIEHLGSEPLLWAYNMQTSWNNIIAADFIKSCFRPLLPAHIKILHANFIEDAVEMFEHVASFDFKSFAPVPAGYIFKQFRLHNDKWKLGFVINTSKGVGDHWVSLFVNLKLGKIFYFDSLAQLPNRLVGQTIDSIITLLKQDNLIITDDVYCSTRRKQFESTECGVYVVWFIEMMLNGHSLLDIDARSLPDAECWKLRNKYWNLIDCRTPSFKDLHIE